QGILPLKYDLLIDRPLARPPSGTSRPGGPAILKVGSNSLGAQGTSRRRPCFFGPVGFVAGIAVSLLRAAEEPFLKESRLDRRGGARPAARRGVGGRVRLRAVRSGRRCSCRPGSAG